MAKVAVYEDENGFRNDGVIARVEYNQMLDNWNGSNWQRDGVGRHLGLAILRDGRPVLIHGTDWQGEESYGVTVTEKEALDKILTADNADKVLAIPRFKPLRELAAKLDAQEA